MSACASESQKLWREVCSDLEAEFASLDITIVGDDGIKDFDGFQAAMNVFCRTYRDKRTTSLARDKISAGMQHLLSFEKAISLSAQLSMPSALLWAGTMAVFQAVCRFATHMTTILDEFNHFYTALPRFDEYLEIYSGAAPLAYQLRNIFKDYGKLCIEAVRWMMRKPFVNAFRNLVSSSPEARLKAVIASMEHHKKEFKEEAECLLHRRLDSPRGHRSRPSAVRSSPSNQSAFLVVGRRDRRFTGRDAVLNHIHAMLSSPKTSPLAEATSYLLHGLSGIGKTSTALEYAYRHRESYDSIFWLTAETTSDLVRSWAQVVSRLRSMELIPPGSESGDDTGTDCARDWFETTKHKWLLVFDNVEDWASISKYWPKSAEATSAIIVTAQNQEFRRQCSHSYLLPDLSVENGSDLLMSYVHNNEPASWDEEVSETAASKRIVEMFGGLPLALAHIGGYISDAHCTLPQFIDFIEKRYPSLWECDLIVPGTQSTNKPKLSAIWDFALQELPIKAKTVLYTMAFLNSDTIHSEMFTGVGAEVYSRPDPLPSPMCSAEEFHDLVRRLIKRALLRADNETRCTYLMHRALQRAIIYKLDKDPAEREKIFQEAAWAVRRITPAASPIQVPTLRLWMAFERAVPHVMALEAAFSMMEPAITGSVELARLLYDAAFNTWERESGHDGLRLLKTAEKILNALDHDPSSRLRPDIYAVIGVICDNIGISERETALRYRRLSVPIRQVIYDRLHPTDAARREAEILLHNSLNDTAESYLQYYDFANANQLIDQCYQRYQTWGTETDFPFEYGKYYRNKSTVLMLQRQFDAAIKSAQRACELQKLHSGVGPRYLFYKQDLAGIVLQSGDLETALQHQLELYKLRNDICGKFHDVTLQSAYAVGAMYYHRGDPAEAE
ncbi:P-loop containing nucleoside triphosphate hydrolase protein [Podospora aff. communis PSN243]|uniref:P-loop containing nucleoside triphosphate hydrolase protein n=1 Tax=Podospora aff. communis PSN243 TaxID=3040156 RepID=A0AAV9G7N2_9PEZI|nr:P-loop containing nucleoside triphosphate hydrolase protein [Podospora aff. communis PSN243]